MCNSHVLIPIPEFIKSDPLCSSANDPNAFDGSEYAIDSEGRQCFVIDECLIPALKALWDQGIKTSGCCCGHGTGSGVIGLITAYDRGGLHLSEAPPYNLVDVVERRRHENLAYERGRRDGLVEAGREDILLTELINSKNVEKMGEISTSDVEDIKPANSCGTCAGCGQIANDDEGCPWKYWAELKPPVNLAVVAGIVKPLTCPTCEGTGKQKSKTGYTGSHTPPKTMAGPAPEEN